MYIFALNLQNVCFNVNFERDFFKTSHFCDFIHYSDKTICSKYFTAVCVRLFLETPEKKKEITQFSHKFEVTGMVDEKVNIFVDKEW